MASFDIIWSRLSTEVQVYPSTKSHQKFQSALAKHKPLNNTLCISVNRYNKINPSKAYPLLGREWLISLDNFHRKKFLKTNYCPVNVKLELSDPIPSVPMQFSDRQIGDHFNLPLKVQFNIISNCSKCGEYPGKDAELLLYNNRVWHKECFMCYRCLSDLDPDKFYEIRGELVCSKDYHHSLVPKCKSCDKHIHEKIIAERNSFWHQDCFYCELCNQNITEKCFYENGKKRFCEKCIVVVTNRKIFAYTCSGCKEPIHELHDSAYIEIDNQIFHSYHFKCYLCDRSFVNQGIKIHNGEMYCQECHDRTIAEICFACKKPIETQCIRALNKSWHSEHFVCFDCRVSFGETKFFEFNRKAYCLSHYLALKKLTCGYCLRIIGTSATIRFRQKEYCMDHFRCFICEVELPLKMSSRKLSIDYRPMCDKCRGRLPYEFVKRLRKTMKNDEMYLENHPVSWVSPKEF